MPGSSSVASQISPSERSTSLPTETRPAKPTPRALPREAARRSCCRCGRRRRCGPTGSSASSKAAFAVSIALLRRSTTPRLDGPTRRMPVRAHISRSRASRATPGAPVSAKPSASTVATRTPSRPHSSTASIAASRRRHDIGVLRHLRQRRKRGPGALAQHALAPGIDRIDAAGIAHRPQKFQRPSGGLAGIVRLPDDGNRARSKQCLREGGGEFHRSKCWLKIPALSLAPPVSGARTTRFAETRIPILVDAQRHRLS